MTFRVLVVCTGNICRSPMAEHLLRDGLSRRGITDVDVSSAGTHALVGEPMQPHALATLRGREIDGSEFRARQLSAALVEEADLVLAASRDHRAAAVTLHPRSSARSFTLREMDRLLSGVDAAALDDRRTGLVKAAAGQRGLARPDRPEDDDVTDPYRGPAAGYVACAELLDVSTRRLLDLLTG